MRGGVRKLGRGAAAVGAVVTLGVAGWLTWLLPGPQIAAVVGVGAVDGVVSVHECHEGTDAEGYTTGTDCTGWYTPRRPGEAEREIVLATAAEDYRPGAKVEVRTARGRAYELSGTAVANFGTGAGLLLVPFLTLAAWLTACARRGRVENGEGYFFAALAAMVAVLVLGMAAGALVGIGTFVL
ncbi:hypothetical protein AB0892_11380 [Streptomyces sp. NPDC005409]|uniref:hypothetical protein n=1 Tax=Streptomyces sp. NPDC005409 TaxID=3155342 RepID=UPI003454FAC5